MATKNQLYSTPVTSITPQSTILCLPPSLLLLVHLHILQYAHVNNVEYDHNIFDSRTRGLRERAKIMEDIAYFLVGKIEGKGVKMILSSYPCIQPTNSLAFRTSLAKYLDNLRQQAVYRNTKSANLDSASWWKDVVVRKSLLEECSGGKFERLMLSLSTHTLMSASRPLATESISELLHDLPIAYATTLAKYQATRHVWMKEASLITKSELDLKALHERLQCAPCSNYSTLSTTRLQALVESRLQNLLQRHWTGADGKVALLLAMELAGLRLDSKQLFGEIPGISSAKVVACSLPIAAAHHPEHLKRLRRPVFQTKNTALGSSRSHSEIILSGYIDSAKHMHKTLAATLVKTKKTTMAMTEKYKAFRSTRGNMNNAPGFQTLAHEQGVLLDFNPIPDKELLTALGLEYGAFDPDDTGADTVEKRIEEIRASILPAYPPIPDLSTMPLPPRDFIKVDNVAKSNVKTKTGNNPRILEEVVVTVIPVQARSSLQVPPMDIPQTPAMSPGKSSRSIRRKSAWSSMARRRTARPSMFAAFDADLNDEVDKLIDETHDFPTDDEDTENEGSLSSSCKTPRPKQKINRIWTAGTPISKSKARNMPRPRMPSGLTRSLDMEPTLSMPSLASSTSSISSDALNVNLGIDSEGEDVERLLRDVDATPRPVRHILHRQTSRSAGSLDGGHDNQGHSGSMGEEDDEEFFGNDPPSMTLKEILLNADTNAFDLLEESNEGIDDGDLVEDASFVWE